MQSATIAQEVQRGTFLYRRLETLPETAGRFRLKELPIPFDGWGRMEVDLLGADSK